MVGHPLFHSISPMVHRGLFKFMGFTNFEYELFSVKPCEFNSKFSELKRLSGFNVTMPYKVKIMEKLTKLDESVLKFKSCNLVCVDGNELIGHNTDWFGLKKTADGINANFSGDVLLLGFGGSGRMVAFKTLEENGKLTIAVRKKSFKKAVELKDELLKSVKKGQIEIVELNKIPLKHYNIMVNATPVGMFPNFHCTPVGLEICSLVDCVIDLIYNPCETVLLRLAKSLGKKTANGVLTLVWQAVLANKIWSGFYVDEIYVKKLIKEVEEKLKKPLV